MSETNNTTPKRRWAFVMEPERCIDCEACMIACSVENQVPLGMHRTWITEVERGTFPDVSIGFLPENCHHCSNPPCVQVCPTGASYQRDDGIVLIDYDKCINCKYCIAACPYDARFVNEERNTADKCTFCVHRLDAGLPPACVETCVGGSRHFGDINDPNSDVSKLLAQYESTPLHPETGTGPNIYYINKNKPKAAMELVQEAPLPTSEITPMVTQLWQKLAQPMALGMLGLSVVVTGAAYRFAHRNADQHFIEVVKKLEKEKTELSSDGKPVVQEILRYRFVQRVGHAVNAIAFILLFITGAFLFFPDFGLFASRFSRTIHRIAAVILILGPIFYFVTSRDKFVHLLKASFTYNKNDLIWLLKMPFYFIGKVDGLPPQGEINAGQRLHHAATVIFYNLVAWSGILLWIGKNNLPNEVFVGSLMVHDISMTILTVLMVGHVYFSFVYGAVKNMITGRISRAYAQVEHPLWLQELEARANKNKE